MIYIGVNGIVYITNGAIIGYITDGVFNSFLDLQKTYKIKMKSGHLIEYFKGRLYVA